MMAPQTSLQAVRWAVRRFGTIRHVQFFGGEPTLNLNVIDLVCEFFRFHVQRGLLDCLPSFGITTNGFRLTETALVLLERHKFSVTVSLDGPAEVQNSVRPARDGGPTYDAVAGTIDALRERGVEIELECTYSAEHTRRGIGVDELLAFFQARFGCRVVHCPLAVVGEDSQLFVPHERARTTYEKAVRSSVRSLAEGRPAVLSTVARWLDCLRQRRPVQSYCPAGRSALTVDVDGRILACFMLANRFEALLGHVTDVAPPNYERFRPLLEASDTRRHPECANCWLQPLCFGCIGDDLARCGNRALGRSAGSGGAAGCDFRRGQAESLLVELAAVMADFAANK